VVDAARRTGVADRSYAIAVDGSDIYVGGYTKGSLGGANRGDKDLFLARLDADGRQVWLRQVGSAADDKAMAIAVSGGAVYVAGTTAGSLGTPAGGIDGFVTRYSSSADPVWMTQFGTPESDEAWGLQLIHPAASTSPATPPVTSRAPWPATRTSWSPESTATAYSPGGINSEPPATTRAPH
jgi:hypothetical protein